LKGQQDGFGEEKPKLVQETGRSPFDGGATLHVLSQLRVRVELLGLDVVEQEDDQLVVSVVERIPERDSNVRPFGFEIRSREDDQDSGARLGRHRDRVVERGARREVSLVKTQSVGGRPVLEGRGQSVVDKVGVLGRVADVDVEQFVLESVSPVGDDGRVAPALVDFVRLGVEPVLDFRLVDADRQESGDEDDDRKDDGDQDGNEIRSFVGGLDQWSFGVVAQDVVRQIVDQVVSNALDARSIGDSLSLHVQELSEGSGEIALARPKVFGQVDGHQEWVVGQVPNGEGG